MMDLAVHNLAGFSCTIKAVSFSEPVIQRARSGMIDRRYRFIGSVELNGRDSIVYAHALIMDGISVQLHCHSGIVIWKPKPPRSSDRNPTRGIQAEKPDAASAWRLDVGTDV